MESILAGSFIVGDKTYKYEDFLLPNDEPNCAGAKTVTVGALPP